VAKLLVGESHPEDGGTCTPSSGDILETLRVEIEFSQHLKETFCGDGTWDIQEIYRVRSQGNIHCETVAHHTGGGIRDTPLSDEQGNIFVGMAHEFRQF
jgi:hypothetical protein